MLCAAWQRLHACPPRARLRLPTTPLAGVTWFNAICAALGADPGPAYRSLLLGLCPGLLKGPFNDAERGAVGLPVAWYDPQHWKPELRAAAEAAAAAAGRAQQLGAVTPAAGTAGVPAEAAAAALAPVGDTEALQELAVRLRAMLGLELSNLQATSS